MKTKPLDFSNVLKHAFLSGFVAAREIPAGEECNGLDHFLNYEPYQPGSYERIHKVLFDTVKTNGYENLKRVLDLAYEQSAGGKGTERHAGGRRFNDQPIFKIADLVGVGFQTGQAIKKIQEAVGMMERGQHDAAQREFLGAIVYTAAAFLTSEKLKPNEFQEIFYNSFMEVNPVPVSEPVETFEPDRNSVFGQPLPENLNWTELKAIKDAQEMRHSSEPYHPGSAFAACQHGTRLNWKCVYCEKQWFKNNKCHHGNTLAEPCEQCNAEQEQENEG